MSIHTIQNKQADVATVMLDILASEEINVTTAAEELKQAKLDYEDAKRRIQALRTALAALGIENTSAMPVA